MIADILAARLELARTMGDFITIDSRCTTINAITIGMPIVAITTSTTTTTLT